MTQSYLKFNLQNENYYHNFDLIIVLLLLEQKWFLENYSNEKNMIQTLIFKYCKRVFVLLVKFIIVHMGLICIYVQCFGFEKFIIKYIKNVLYNGSEL